MKVGCVLLDINDEVIALGFNHLGKTAPVSMYQDREGRRPFVIHAEIAALSSIYLNSDKPITAIVTLLPCTHCMCALASFGVKSLYYHQAYDKDLKAIEVAKHYSIAISKIKL
jgi:deoxycytidylate deaminase